MNEEENKGKNEGENFNPPSARISNPAEELKKELDNCQKIKEEYLAGWQRARADFLNYKKEEMERIERLVSYAGVEFILKILPILDNFDIAEKKLEEDSVKDESLKGKASASWGASLKGFLQIKKQLLDFLKSQGVKEIKARGEKFDPNFHEVVEQIEAKDKEAGIVIEEAQKGYTIQGKLLRPAKVKITK